MMVYEDDDYVEPEWYRIVPLTWLFRAIAKWFRRKKLISIIR